MTTAILDCPEESEMQSDYSPSVVDDDENLLRTVYHDTHIDSNNLLTNTNIPIGQIIEPKGDGISVCREPFFKGEVAQDVVEYFESNPKNKVKGFFKARTGDIRELLISHEDEDRKMCCVVDNGLAKNISHALIKPSKLLRISIEGRKARRAEENKMRPIRDTIISQFNKTKFVPLEEIVEPINPT